MRGSVTIKYTRKLPPIFEETIREAKPDTRIISMNPLVLKHDYDIDGLLNLIIGIVEMANIKVTQIELFRDTPDVYQLFPEIVPSYPTDIQSELVMALG